MPEGGSKRRQFTPARGRARGRGILNSAATRAARTGQRRARR